MDYAKFIKKLELPAGFTAPAELVYEDLAIRALARAHLEDDVRGINASIDLIRETRGGPWPAEPVTEDFDFVDLVWHELEFRDAASFAYAVYGPGDEYLGCCYLYPMGHRTELSEERLAHDVDVSWWVTPDAYARGYYAKLYRALRRWTTEEFPFHAPYYSNAEIPSE